MELRSIDPTRNRRRVYRLTETLTLFDRELLIEWGREGRPLRRRVEAFATPAELEARRRELLTRRRLHGYVSSAGSAGAGDTESSHSRPRTPVSIRSATHGSEGGRL